LIEIGSKTAENNSAQTNRQTDRHYENNGHLAVNQLLVYNSQCVIRPHRSTKYKDAASCYRRTSSVVCL